jgi:hypothetical protein
MSLQIVDKLSVLHSTTCTEPVMQGPCACCPQGLCSAPAALLSLRI